MTECVCRPVAGTRYYDASDCPVHKRGGWLRPRKVMK